MANDSYTRKLVPVWMEDSTVLDEECIEVEFMVSYNDAHGHSSSFNVKLHNQTAARLAKIKGLDLFPYEDTNDIVRHAVERHLTWLETFVAQEPDPAGARLRMMDRTNNRRTFIAKAKHSFEDAKALTEGNIRHGQYDAALEVLQDARRTIEGFKGLQRTQLEEYYRLELQPLYDKAQSMMCQGLAENEGLAGLDWSNPDSYVDGEEEE